MNFFYKFLKTISYIRNSFKSLSLLPMLIFQSGIHAPLTALLVKGLSKTFLKVDKNLFFKEMFKFLLPLKFRMK